LAVILAILLVGTVFILGLREIDYGKTIVFQIKAVDIDSHDTTSTVYLFVVDSDKNHRILEARDGRYGSIFTFNDPNIVSQVESLELNKYYTAKIDEDQKSILKIFPYN